MITLSRFKKILVIAGILLALLFLVAGYFIISGDETNVSYLEDQTKYDDGWDISIAGSKIDSSTLPVYVETKPDESAEFKKTLPSEIADDHAIITRNYHQVLRAYIDEELIFSYPDEDWNGIGNIISDEWCLIPLKPEYAGRTLRISFNNHTVFTFDAYIGEFYYGEHNSLVQHIKNQGLYGVLLGIIICAIGGLLLIVSFIYRKHTNQALNTAMGMALLCFGIWMVNRAKMDIFPHNSLFVYWGSIMALMLVAPFAFLYSFYRNQEFKRVSLWGFRWCLIADIFLACSSLFIKYDAEIITIFAYTLTCIALGLNAYSLYLGGFGRKSKGQSHNDLLLNRAEFISNLIFPLFFILEFIFYPYNLWTDASNLLRTGICLYTIIFFVFVLWRTFMVVQDRTVVTQKLHESQLELMMGQIQPHFIFNTLSSIRTLIKVDPQISYDMLYDFSNYLRANIDNVTNLDGIRFAAEVEHIKSYVNIEKVRFGDRLNVEYDIVVDKFTVPPLSIQPLVENAIKHGVCKKVGGGTVFLSSYADEDYNIVEVRDDGVGFNADTASKVFYIPDENDPDSDKRNSVISKEAINEAITSLILLDKDDNPIEITKPKELLDLSGNGSEGHQSTGMLNILLRLKEISDAKVEINSKEGEGTTIKVCFPKITAAKL